MATRRINPLALALCIAAVLAIGYVMVAMTASPPLEKTSARQFALESAPTLDVHEPSAPMAEMAPMAAPPPPRMPGPAAGPAVSPTAAPGVAFNYRYAFRLPGDRIARVQEQHARACERLGVHRCRITGLRYRVLNDRGVEAMLALKLEPGIARRFGQAAIGAVTGADGTLVESEISGTDADASIRSASRSIAQLSDDLRRIEARLGQRLSADERTRLDYEARQLSQAIRAAEAGREEQQEAQASTPLVFQYEAGAAAPVGSRPSLGQAVERALDNFVEGVSILFILLVTLLPWALLALAGWWIVRLVLRRSGFSAPQSAAVEPA